LDQEETTWALADAYRAWVAKYGIARALYVDGKTVYGAWANPAQKKQGEERSRNSGGCASGWGPS
jgi:hypothetical protein